MESIRIVIRETGLILLALLRPAIRSLRDNTGLAGVSVALAFGLWILVTDADNPTLTKTLPMNLQVQAVNVPADVVVENELVSVEVRVRVADHVFESLTEADFEAVVDLAGLSVGQHELAPQVRALTSRGGLRIEQVSPGNVTVKLAPLVSKDVPVILDLRGSPPAEYAIGDPRTDDDSVRASGAQAKVDLVTQAYAFVDVTGRTAAIEQSIRLTALDDRGNPVEGVTLEPGVTNVAIDITKVVYSKPVVVAPVIEGTPDPDYEIRSVSVRPVTVVVSGSEEFISQVQTIKTEAVDVDGADGDVVVSVSLDLSGLPEGSSVVGGGTVTVTVRIERRAGVYRLPESRLARI
jgi:YbbR domain-containing protein